MWRGDVLDGGGDVAEIGVRYCGGDAGHHREARRVDQLDDLGRRLADHEGPGTVAVPAVVDRSGVNRHDLAVADLALAGDPVDNLVVDRDAEAGRERVASMAVPLERWHRPGRADMALGKAVEVSGGDAWPQLGFDEGQDLGHDPAGGPHLLDLAA